MVDKNKSLVVALVDRSGSMVSFGTAVVEGMNEFIGKQRAQPGECFITYVQFDHEYELVHDFAPINSIHLLNVDTYQPRGRTALLDALGRTINDVGAKLAAMPEGQRPGSVIFVIFTDGLENDSREFTAQRVTKMVTKQTKEYNWKFIYLGANIDAFTEGSLIGFDSRTPGQLVANYSSSPQGFVKSAQAASHAAAASRASVRLGDDGNFSDDVKLETYSILDNEDNKELEDELSSDGSTNV